MKAIFSVVSFTVILITGNGQSIPSKIIGEQIWMTKNLNLEKFRNGDPIPQVKTQAQWKKAREEKKPAWCYYNNDPVNGVKFGKLYNWFAVTDPRGLAPKGWHIPNEEEWKQLVKYLDDIDGA